jgi:hypothetical protein
MATRRDDSNGGAENLLHLPVLFVDLDFRSSDEAATRTRLEHFLLPPTITWHSGGGLHCLWKLAEPIDLREAREVEEAGAFESDHKNEDRSAS